LTEKGKYNMMGVMLEDAMSASKYGDKWRLRKGEEVILYPATNQPEEEGKVKYFVAPADGRWGDETLLLTDADVSVA
jgi:hypothetical protein